MLTVRGLTKIYANRYDAHAGGVRDIGFSLPPGTFFTLLGPSGCGKTTTLRCIAGLERPDKGFIALGDRVLFDGETKIAVPMNQRGIGMVFQSYAIWPHMTVFENIAFPLRVSKQRRYSREEIRSLVDQALTTVGLAGYGDRPATRLSGGQQQRVALARAIVHQPQLLLLDEPLSNLDASLREEMRAELRRLQQQIGITAIYVTHDQAGALAMSDLVAVMDRGHIVQLGEARTVYFRPESEFVASFIGAANLLGGTTIAAVEAGAVGRLRLDDGEEISCLFPAGSDAGRPGHRRSATREHRNRACHDSPCQRSQRTARLGERGELPRRQRALRCVYRRARRSCRSVGRIRVPRRYGGPARVSTGGDGIGRLDRSFQRRRLSRNIIGAFAACAEPRQAVPRAAGLVSSSSWRQSPCAHEVRIFPAGLAVAKFFSVHRTHRASRGFEHRLWRAGVPFHRAAEPRIEVGDPFRKPAELYAGAEIDQVRHVPAAQELIQSGAAAMITARQNGQSFLRRQARTDRHLVRSQALPCTAPDDTAEQFACGRDGDHTQNRSASTHQADIHRELIIAGSEFACAVQRIHEPVFRCWLGDAPAGHLLLGNHRNARRRLAQAFDDNCFGGMVGFGDRRTVFLAYHIEAARAHRQDCGTRLQCERRSERDQIVVIHVSVIPIECGESNARG